MSIKINVGSMNYNQLSCAQRADMEKKRKNRLVQVREQSKEIAQQVREKVQCEKKNQLRKFQEVKRKELENLKRRQCEMLRDEYAHCLENFGAAHIAACEASCEEDEAIHQRREEYDLMAAERGRAAMTAEQRKRDREAEERLAKRKRKNLRSVSVQADVVSRREVGIDVRSFEDESENESENENRSVRVGKFKNKPNLHKSQSAVYNPKDYTSNSVDSSNNLESEDEESLVEIDSEVEFNQITNLLKQKAYNFHREVEKEKEIVDMSSSSDSDPPQRVHPQKQVKFPTEKKGILKKIQPTKTPKKTQKVSEDDQRVNYLDFRNKHVSSYIPNNDLVTQNPQKSAKNAKTAAEKLTQRMVDGVVGDDVLRQLAEIREKEALEKEKTRRDYEKLRLQLDDLAKEELEARAANSKAFKSISAHSFHAQEQIRVAKMNQAVENAMQRNIITCPPVATLQAKKKTCVVNVGAPEGSVEILDLPRKSTDEINNMVKVERLKDLLERINHQKKLLLNEIEKSEEIPGPDLEQVMKCLEKLEKEKAAIDKQPDKKNKEIEELNARERKVEEREKRLEDKIRELFKKQQEKKKIKEKEATESVTSEDASSTHPVKITIELNSPRSKKQKKTIKVVELVDQEPKKVYPRTPRKNIQENFEEELEKVQEVLKKLPEAPKKVQQQTQTTPPSEAAPRPILKKQSPIGSLKPTGKSDDSSQSVSTSYQSLPDKISPAQRDAAQKSHQKLNPVLMHYIQRLLGMGKNFGNQLSVAVSPVTTPGSSTINNSGNNESGSDGIPVFDKKRLDKLQEFINDNYSFLSEINETLERSQMNEENEENINKVDGIWKDVLRTKKPGRSEKPAEKTSKPKITVQEATKVTNRSAQLPVRPQTSKSSNRLQIPAAKLNIPPVRPQTSRGLRHQSSAQQILRQQETAVRQPSRHQEVTQQQQVTSRPSQSQPPINRPKSLSSLSQATPQAQPSIRPQISNRDMINVTKYLESHIMSNYAEYTANCQKRISDLALMMERVRQEKLKLIEHSLSSGEFGQFTEYKEIAVAGKVQDQPTTSASDLKDSRDDPASEEINNILQKQTRPFGVSKDSGISVLSRPVTSSDFRDSPDVRVTSEERENTFQPILKPPGDGTENIDEVIKEQDEKAKKQKPPPSRNRLSPTLDPHELSTIAEVETPSASKVNLIAEEFAGVESFTKFEEYARKFADRSAMFPNMMEALDCEKIASFLHPNDYGIQEISRENVEVLPLSRASSNSSIVDVLSELRRRNLLPNDGFHENDEAHTTPIATQQVIQVPQSPKRNPPQSRIIIKTPEKFHVEIQTGTPSKRKQAKPRRDCLESPQSNDTLSGIQEIEKESRDELQLGKLGLNWATSMLKRDVQSQNLASSSSSSSVDKGNSIRIEIETNETTSSSSTAGPMNLRQFLIRELNQRSLQEKSSSDESSLSSQFMRSLLNASSKGGTSSGNTSANDRLRTSTPVMTKGSSSQFVTQKSGGTSMFPGESLSTLKGSDRGESDKSIEKQT